MENKDLISKWLNGELSPRELQDLKKSADYRSYKDIVENAAKFQRPHFDEQQGLHELKERLSKPEQVETGKSYAPFYRAAAILVVLLGTGLFFWLNSPKVISTGKAEMAVVELPDESTVRLNAASRIKFRPSAWDKSRTLKLDGEAFFEVEKGKKFTVETEQGKISVLGTKFNVKDREDFFEVYCYEGAVKVVVENREIILSKGNFIRMVAGEVDLKIFDKSLPGWTQRESEFDAVPLKEVLAELERQFDLEITTEDVEVDQLFTGTFSHMNRETALKSVTIPLQLEFRFTSDRKVVLYEE